MCFNYLKRWDAVVSTIKGIYHDDEDDATCSSLRHLSAMLTTDTDRRVYLYAKAHTDRDMQFCINQDRNLF
jgi:hypothetical protein